MADGTDLENTLSSVEQRAYVPNLDTGGTSDVPGRIDDVEKNWNFEGMVTAGEVDLSGLRGKL